MSNLAGFFETAEVKANVLAMRVQSLPDVALAEMLLDRACRVALGETPSLRNRDGIDAPGIVWAEIERRASAPKAEAV